MGIMKNCKKLLSVIVTLLLAASLLTSSAFAISGEAFIATPGEVNLRDSGSFNSRKSLSYKWDTFSCRDR